MEEDVDLKRLSKEITGKIAEEPENLSLESVLKGINLHYFFDALHIIKGYMVVDEKKAMDVINLLARTVRRGVRILKEGKAYTMISDELEYIRLYLELAQVHYGKAEYVILNNSKDFTVPIFTVRHMVEDAFCRCLTVDPEFRKLRIYLFSDSTHDYIEIKDSGKVLLEEEIEQLMEGGLEGQGSEYQFYRELGWRVEVEGLPDEGNRVFLSHPRKE